MCLHVSKFVNTDGFQPELSATCTRGLTSLCVMLAQYKDTSALSQVAKLPITDMYL